MMADNPVFDRLKEIMETIDDCLKARRIVPALILLYTLIDSIGWLAASNANGSVKKRFTRWVDDWLLKSGSLPCTSLELYAARCGVLHSLTSDSDLSAARKVRRVIYSFGKTPPSPLQEVSNRLRPNEFVAVRLEDLYEAFRNGLIAYLEDTMQHPSKKAAFEARATGHFMHLNQSNIIDLLSQMDHEEKSVR